MVLYRDSDYGDSVDLPGITAVEVDMAADAAQFDITIQFTETSNGLKGLLIYGADVFEDCAAVGGAVGHGGAADGGGAGDMPVSELVVLPGTLSEIWWCGSGMTRRWRSTTRRRCGTCSVATRRGAVPDAPAVTAEWEGVRSTYAELARSGGCRRGRFV